MKKIPLTQGQFALVDDADYEWLSQFKWQADWCEGTGSYYARRTEYKDGKKSVILMHREILGLELGDELQADHVNHDTLDNRRSELRVVTHEQNHWNQRNTRGYSFSERFGKYKARIRVQTKEVFLGYHDTPEEAREAYLKAKRQYHVL